VVSLNDKLGGGAVTLDAGSGSSFKFTGAGNLTVGNVSTTNGTLTLQTAGGSLKVRNGAQVLAQNGNVVLNDTNTKIGVITLDTNSSVTALAGVKSASAGNVIVAVGAVPKTGTNPLSTSGNITVAT